MNYEFYAPFPPSDNNYYVQTRNGKFISPKGKKFRADMELAILQQLPDVRIDHTVLVEVVLYMPDRRVRDVANYMKALMDAISKADLWVDDVLIDQLFIYRGVVAKDNAHTFLRITDAGPKIPLGMTDF